MKIFQYFVWLFLSATVSAEQLLLSELDRDGIRWVIVSADQLQPFYGIDMEMTFSADRLMVVSGADNPVAQVTPGTLFRQDVFTIVNRVDMKTGTIRYAASVLNPAPAVEGSGVLFSIPFRTKGKESGEFTIVRVATGNRSGEKRALPAPASVSVMPPVSVLPQTRSVAADLSPFVTPAADKAGEAPFSLLVVGLGMLLLILAVVTLLLFRRLKALEKERL